ncbi:hypothetical protein OF83DRAFT_1174066 [Amylostereum chailletii]|nr:hypothetical protein OF83DRAFT_1174066 [Amylostereum chailletii]
MAQHRTQVVPLPDQIRRNMLSKRLRTSTAPLSQLLYEDRPLLKPIVFVRSEITPKLFMEEEEIFKPVADEAGDLEQSHVPTADRVFNVFNHTSQEEDSSRVPSDGEEKLEEIDFEDMAKAVAEVEAIAASKAGKSSTNITTKAETVQETFTGFYVDTTPARTAASSSSIQVDRVGGNVPLGEDDDEVIVYVAPHPRNGKAASPSKTPRGDATAIETFVEQPALPQDNPATIFEATSMDIDGIYEAAPSADTLPMPIDTPASSSRPAEGHSTLDPTAPVECSGQPQTPPAGEALEATNPDPQSSTTPAHSFTEPAAAVTTSFAAVAIEALPIPPAPSVAEFSFSFAPSPSKPRQVANLPRALRKDKQPRTNRLARRRREHPSMFGAFGAMMSEERLHGRDRDPRRDEQRRGDSDVDWGDTSGDELSTGTGGMELDSELEMNVQEMEMFVKGMQSAGQNHMSMGDVEDEVRTREEDEESQERGSESESGEEDEEDEEVEMVLSEEEKRLVGEGEDDDEDEDDEDDEDSSDEEETPKRGFQARLERLRQRSNGKGVKDLMEEGLNNDEDDFTPGFNWGDGDKELSAVVQDFLDENEVILKGRSLRDQNRLFHQIHSGDFDSDDPTTPAKRRKEKNKDLPRELQEQWERDRKKKADRKRERTEERLIAAADPLSQKRGGKKGRKEMLKVASLDPRIAVPNRVVDFASLEQQIRRFLDDIGGPDTMVLPPMDKSKRKMVHELAQAFNLKSESKGKGLGRYTSLIKTTKSGVNVNDRKVRSILKRMGVRVDGGVGGWNGDGKGKGDGGKIREGDIVGKAAPKIGEANVGFQMLAAMGWAEGSRIGASGGLEVPLTAVVKNTKLGLGASRG